MQTNNEHIDLIFKHLSAETNDAEKKMLFDWINEDTENQKIFNEYQKVWDMSGDEVHPELGKININKEWKLFKENSGFDDISIERNKQKRKSSVLRIIASVAAVFIFVFAAIWFLKPNEDVLYAETQLIESELPDGSKITINKNSKIKYNRQFNKEERKVELEGDAYFKIAKDANKPFIIDAETFYVEVLGTEFYVNSNYNERKVVVQEGIVAVYQKEDKSDQIVLNAGEEIIFDKKENVMRKIETFDENYISWKTKIFKFNNQSLEEIFEYLADVYDIQYEFMNTDLKNCRQSVSFENQTIDEILNVLRATFDKIKFEKDSTSPKIYINGNSCN